LKWKVEDTMYEYGGEYGQNESFEVEVGVVLAEVKFGCQHAETAHSGLALLPQVQEQVPESSIEHALHLHKVLPRLYQIDFRDFQRFHCDSFPRHQLSALVEAESVVVVVKALLQA
jgi:hypothetical protein